MLLADSLEKIVNNSYRRHITCNEFTGYIWELESRLFVNIFSGFLTYDIKNHGPGYPKKYH